MDEKTILHQILEADRLGREALEKARRDGEDFDRRCQSLRREAEEQAEERVRREIERARTQALSRVQDDLDKLRHDYEYRLSMLRAQYEAGAEGWAEQLFRTVVGLDD